MEIAEKIEKLKKERHAVILAHNYELPEVQDCADFVGDSLELSVKAADTDAEVIVFCGVHFMAETAKILSPEKTVLLPDMEAGCPMADMITADQLLSLKTEHPQAKAVCYVNTTAAVKAHCDLCCTSANAVKMVGEVLKDEPEIIFVPDQYLAAFVSAQTGRKMIVWNGFCPVHAEVRAEDIQKARALHPNAAVMVHPECRPEVTALADATLSTGGMSRYARETRATEIIVGTETGIIHKLKKENPDKKFYAVSESFICADMKRTTLEKVLFSLQNMVNDIQIPEQTAARAKAGIDRMLAASR